MKTLVVITVMVTFLWASPVHTKYSELLSYAVCESGVAYEKLYSGEHLADAAHEFETVTKDDLTSCSEAEKIAWYSNLYNFYTIKLIVEKKPQHSIQDIPGAWDIKFVPLFGKKVSLNYIEHTILRKDFYEPRIHFALNCASIGCPALRVTPFTGEELNVQLDEQALLFLKDKSKNRVEGKTLYLSQIFQWYGTDFKREYGSFEEYVKGVLGLEGKFKLRYTNYDWNLNQSSCK